MDSARFLRKLQDIYKKHKLISNIFFFLFILPISGFYGFFSMQHLNNMFLTNPSNSEDTYNNLTATTFHYITAVVEVEGFGVLAISMMSLLTTPISILASEKIDTGMELSFKSLIVILTKSAKSLLITWFSVMLLKLGYIFVCMSVFHHQLMLNSSGHEQSQFCDLPAGSGTLILVAGAVLFYTYLAVVWNLALVISSHEEKSVLEAFGKASRLLEGRKLPGFLINLVLGILSLTLFVGWEYLITCSNMSEADKRSISLNILNCIILIEVWSWGFFLIVYLKCKKAHGEEIHLHGSLKHIETPSQQPLIGDRSLQIV